MPSLAHWEEKIKEKRKKTPWREFVKEIGSWMPMTFYRKNGETTRYPSTSRTREIIPPLVYDSRRDDFLFFGQDFDSSQSFIENYANLFQKVPLASRMVYLSNHRITPISSSNSRKFTKKDLELHQNAYNKSILLLFIKRKYGIPR